MSTTQQVLASLIDNLAAENPLDGVKPSISGLGGEFGTLFKRIAAVVWAVGLGFLAIMAMIALTQAGAAKKSGNPGEYNASFKTFTNVGIAFLGLLLLGVILGSVIALSGQG